MCEQRVCPVCESPMRATAQLEAGPWEGSDGPAGAVRLNAICSNPDCPGVASDMAGPSSDEIARHEAEFGDDDGLAGAGAR